MLIKLALALIVVWLLGWPISLFLWGSALYACYAAQQQTGAVRFKYIGLIFSAFCVLRWPFFVASLRTRPLNDTWIAWFASAQPYEVTAIIVVCYATLISWRHQEARAH